MPKPPRGAAAPLPLVFLAIANVFAERAAFESPHDAAEVPFEHDRVRVRAATLGILVAGIVDVLVKGLQPVPLREPPLVIERPSCGQHGRRLVLLAGWSGAVTIWSLVFAPPDWRASMVPGLAPAWIIAGAGMARLLQSSERRMTRAVAALVILVLPVMSFLAHAQRDVVSLESPLHWPLEGIRQYEVESDGGALKMEAALRTAMGVRPEALVLSAIPDTATAQFRKAVRPGPPLLPDDGAEPSPDPPVQVPQLRWRLAEAEVAAPSHEITR